MTLHRRTLIAQAAATLASAPFAYLVGGGSAEDTNAAASPSLVRSNQHCTLGFSTYGMKSLTTERALEVLAEIGFDAVELTVRSGWDADSARMVRSRRAKLAELLKQRGLRLTSLMEHVFPTSEETQRDALERLKLAAELAHDLAPAKPPLIQTVLGGGRFEDQKNTLRDRLGAWLRLAEREKITIAIKPHRGGVVSQPAEAVWLLEQLGAPDRLRIVYDYSHYIFRDLPLEQTVATALPFSAHLAVKDAVQAGERVVFKLPGEAGTIDFAAMLRQFYAGGYRGDINCEVSGMVWSKPNYDPIAAAKVCYRNMAAAMKAAGVPRPQPADNQ